MMFRYGTALLGASMILSGCGQTDSTSFDTAPLDSGDQKASYGVGLNIGGQLADAGDRLDRAAFMRGLEDAMRGAEPAVDGQELQTAMQTFGREIEEAAQAERARAGVEALEAGETYLAENGARDGVMTTESGLQYEVLREGEGASPTVEQRARLHYRGTLIDGTEFDSSYGGDPAEFGVGQLIPGFTEALTLMKPGSHFRVVIPSDIAYGPRGSGRSIGPNSTLIFEIELLEILE